MEIREGSAIDVFGTPTLDPSSASAEAAQLLQEEVDAIVATVPRPFRANALWAVPLLLTVARAGGISHLRRIAYVLATAQHGSHFGARLEQRGNGPIVDGRDRSFEHDGPGTPRGNLLGNIEPGDGERFRGRGFIHVKGRTAYTLWSNRLGIPDVLVDGVFVPYFVAHPKAMARSDIAAQTLVRGMRDGLFTGSALGFFVNDKKTDFLGARRVVGGPEHAREVADIAMTISTAIEDVHANRHRTRMQLSHPGVRCGTHDLMQEIRDAVSRLALRGEILPFPQEILAWGGEARQGKFVQLDDRTFALHLGRGSYLCLDVQRDLNGIAPPEGKNMALKRSGDVRLAARHGELNGWR